MLAEIQSSSSDPAGLPDAERTMHSRRIGEIFQEHNHRLLRFLMGRLTSEQDAREVAQEAYVKLLQLDRPEAVGFLKAFLFKTAANLAIDRVRRKRTVEQRGHCLFDFDLHPSPEATVADAQDARVTLEALAELPAACCSAFLLSRIDGLSSMEIAQRLGVTDRAVRKYLARALLHLQARFDQLES